MSIGKAAEMLGMGIEGLRKWEREGRLIPLRTPTNHFRYRVTDLHALMDAD
ncbi:MAG: MerR family DNA-binding transcriptional regulator [Firmicutes bacterium]|nr:MerR family DNA-binding transcriptional regulator [Bacillota bacterium]